MNRSATPLIVVAISTGVAHGEPPAAAVELPGIASCSTAFGCTRAAGTGGQSTSRVRWRVGPRAALVGIAETAERPAGTQLASQAIVALGERRIIGRGWVEVGVGLAASQVAIASIDPSRLLDSSARPAVVAGAGTTLAQTHGRVLAISIAIGSSADRTLYQVTSGLEAHWF